MRPDDVSVLAMLRQSMSFNAERQRVISENVAHANTPGYAAKDLDVADFQSALQRQLRGQGVTGGSSVRLQTSEAGHMSGSSGAASSRGWETMENPDSETTINGNSVVLEEQMVRAQEVRMQYETALTLYQKNLGLIRTAIRPVGR
ncbi:flagellar basal body rod protein FlgB [Maricaulis parjimensis]|uniref:flagellar basal body rod protein FlgB n=1 Tax=Maricaulis parjimensis TaxID=144023 RepID=UPI00193A021C|nr:flagellar basal body rod protein FlgB [Maricaulis parjimensis]